MVINKKFAIIILVLIVSVVILQRTHVIDTFVKSEEELFIGSWRMVSINGLEFDYFEHGGDGLFTPFTILTNLTFYEGGLVRLSYHDNSTGTWFNTSAVEWSVVSDGQIRIINGDDIMLDEFEFITYDKFILISEGDEYIFERII